MSASSCARDLAGQDWVRRWEAVVSKSFRKSCRFRCCQKLSEKFPRGFCRRRYCLGYEAMIQKLSRKFEMVDEVRTAPSGTVDWATYATEMMPAMKFLSVPVDIQIW